MKKLRIFTNTEFLRIFVGFFREFVLFGVFLTGIIKGEIGFVCAKYYGIILVNGDIIE